MHLHHSPQVPRAPYRMPLLEVKSKFIEMGQTSRDGRVAALVRALAGQLSWFDSIAIAERSMREG